MSSTRFAPSVSCLAVDEVGRCKFVRACTDLFFDVVDRRHEKEGPNTMIPASNVAPSGWDEFFTGDETLLCALDRLFDKASVFKMRGPSYRGHELDTYSVEAAPQAIKVRGIQPKRAWQRCRPGNRLPAHWPKSADWDWRLSTGWNVVKIA